MPCKLGKSDSLFVSDNEADRMLQRRSSVDDGQGAHLSARIILDWSLRPCFSCTAISCSQAETTSHFWACAAQARTLVAPQSHRSDALTSGADNTGVPASSHLSPGLTGAQFSEASDCRLSTRKVVSLYVSLSRTAQERVNKAAPHGVDQPCIGRRAVSDDVLGLIRAWR